MDERREFFRSGDRLKLVQSCRGSSSRPSHALKKLLFHVKLAKMLRIRHEVRVVGAINHADERHVLLRSDHLSSKFTAKNVTEGITGDTIRTNGLDTSATIYHSL